MKKQIIAVLLVFCMSITVFPCTILAAEPIDSKVQIITLEDGSYITITIQTYKTRATQSLTGSKTCRYTNTNGNVDWEIVLWGTFSYTGSTSACTASSVDINITNNNWYVVSQAASRSYNAAICNVTMGRKVFGITVEEKDYNLTLLCDKDGNLS